MSHDPASITSDPQLQADMSRYLELRAEGLTNNEIAPLLNRTPRTLEGWAARLDAQRWKHRVFTDEDLAAARTAYEQGVPLGTIAKEFECSRQTVMRRLRMAGVEIIRTTNRGHPRNFTAGDKTPSGTRCVSWRLKQDYVLVRVTNDHPLFLHTNGGWIEEHRLRMMEKLGRPLTEGENVHHKNGVRDDNRLRNLDLWSTSQPPGASVDHKIRWAINFLSSHGYTITKE